MASFDPISALLGGALIGLASVLLMMLTGRVAGISGILGGCLTPAAGDKGWRFALGDLDRKANELRSDGATALFLAVDGKPGGIIAIADPIKSTTQAALDALRAWRRLPRRATVFVVLRGSRRAR